MKTGRKPLPKDQKRRRVVYVVSPATADRVASYAKENGMKAEGRALDALLKL